MAGHEIAEHCDVSVANVWLWLGNNDKWTSAKREKKLWEFFDLREAREPAGGAPPSAVIGAAERRVLESLNLVLFNWQQVATSIAAVPDPTAGMLVVLGLLALGIRRRGAVG